MHSVYSKRYNNFIFRVPITISTRSLWPPDSKETDFIFYDFATSSTFEVLSHRSQPFSSSWTRRGFLRSPVLNTGPRSVPLVPLCSLVFRHSIHTTFNVCDPSFATLRHFYRRHGQWPPFWISDLHPSLTGLIFAPETHCWCQT